MTFRSSFAVYFPSPFSSSFSSPPTQKLSFFSLIKIMLCNFVFLCLFSKGFKLRRDLHNCFREKALFSFPQVICYLLLYVPSSSSSSLRISLTLAFSVACGLISLITFLLVRKKRKIIYFQMIIFADLIILFYVHEKMASSAAWGGIFFSLLTFASERKIRRIKIAENIRIHYTCV
jgi:hypothetical protein